MSGASGEATSPVAPTSAMDPLPREFLLPREGRPQGVLKERAEDFLVEELPLYDPCGEGEHLYLGLQKRHMPHGELIRLLQRHFGVDESAIGAAGMKDRIAVVRQTVSVHLPGRAKAGPIGAIDLGTDRVTVLWAAWHSNKLRRGHLKGNRFVIRIRRIEPLAAPSIWRRLRHLAAQGAPNYFGPQRFGYRRNTHRLGALLLAQDWEGLLGELVGARGSAYPDHQRACREAFDEGRLAEALAGWGSNDHSERTALRKLEKFGKPRRAVLAVGDHTRSFWVSALQAAAFNRLLDARLRAGSLASLGEGDVAFRHQGGACFLVGAEDLAGDALAPRLARGEISPAGPLWGAKLLAAGGATAAIEREALREFGVDPASLESGPDAAPGARRPYRVFPGSPELDAGVDEHGGYVKVAFDLPKGAFATVVLRELIDEQPAEPRAAGDAHAEGEGEGE